PRHETRAVRGGLKLGWSPGGRHWLESLTVVDADRSDNGDGVLVEPEAQPTFASRTAFTSLLWRGWFGERVSADAGLALTSARVAESPESCRWAPQLCHDVSPVRDAVTGQLRANHARIATERDRGLDLRGGATVEAFHGRWIEERLRLTSRLALRDLSSDAQVP